MINRFGLILLVLLLLLSGCSSMSVPGFSEVESDDGSGGAEVSAYEDSTVTAAPLQSAAVAGLLAQAQQQREAGQLPEAVVTLERALNIEPRNAHVWNMLAHLRMEQGMTAQAIDLATKSNTLAGPDMELLRDNWLLIAVGRRAIGDMKGALDAEDRAGLLR